MAGTPAKAQSGYPACRAYVCGVHQGKGQQLEHPAQAEMEGRKLEEVTMFKGDLRVGAYYQRGNDFAYLTGMDDAAGTVTWVATRKFKKRAADEAKWSPIVGYDDKPRMTTKTITFKLLEIEAEVSPLSIPAEAVRLLQRLAKGET